MQMIDIRSFIKSLGITVPDDKEFLKLSKSMPIYSENEEYTALIMNEAFYFIPLLQNTNLKMF